MYTLGCGGCPGESGIRGTHLGGLRGHISVRTTLALVARAVELPLRVSSRSDVVFLRVFTTQSSTVRIYWIKVRSEILSHPTPKTHYRMNEISRKFPHSREVCKNGLGGEGSSQTRRK